MITSKPRMSLKRRLMEAARKYKQAVYASGGKISLEDAMAEVDKAHRRSGKKLPGGKS